MPDGSTVRIPQRELFDVRMQLMAGDDALAGSRSTVETLLGGNDVQRSVYEGGLKSWECSLDLVKHLDGIKFWPYNSKGPLNPNPIHILELGCGTAIPTLHLFQRALIESHHGRHFTVADYNIDVLRLVTIPNLLLSWYLVQQSKLDPPMDWTDESDLEVTPALLARFVDHLRQENIAIDAVSGAWGEKFIDLIGQIPTPTTRMVLASETIYSPDSMMDFTKVVQGAMFHASRALALIAAKRLYFGVGGSVDDFIRAIKQHPILKPRVTNVGNEGVARVVVTFVKLPGRCVGPLNPLLQHAIR